MKKTYLTIDEYIQDSPESSQSKLNELRDLIHYTVPPDTIETISYGLPTFKWKKNLIHFGYAKSHIGIYPGSEAITNYKDELKKYKTTKGCIQLPWNEKIPTQLIKNIIAFNIKLIKNK